MNTLIITFEAVFVLLGIGIIGFWVIGRKHVPAPTVTFLTSLAIDIALPFLVLSNLLQEFSPDKYPEWWHLPLWWLGFTVVAIALSLATRYIARKDIRGEFAMSMFFQNGLFFPVILLTGLFGVNNQYLVSLFIFMIFFPSLVFSTYPLFFKNRPKEERLNLGRIVNPVLAATVLGLIIGLSGLRQSVPGFIITLFVMLGAMATPLFLLILGGNVYNDLMYSDKGKKRFEMLEVLKFVLIKNVLFPLVFIGLLVWLRPDHTIAFIILLQAAIPPITATPIFTERSGGNRAITSQYIVGSFLLSLISIPAAIYFYSLFFPLT